MKKVRNKRLNDQVESEVDIITKGHGGTLEMESEEGKGSAFTITLRC